MRRIGQVKYMFVSTKYCQLRHNKSKRPEAVRILFQRSKQGHLTQHMESYSAGYVTRIEELKGCQCISGWPRSASHQSVGPLGFGTIWYFHGPDSMSDQKFSGFHIYILGSSWGLECVDLLLIFLELL